MKSNELDSYVQLLWSASSISNLQFGGVHVAEWSEISENTVGSKDLTLDGREVGAYDLRFRALIGEIYGPYAGAGTNIEDCDQSVE